MKKIKDFYLNHKKMVIIISVVILITILGIGGYLIFREKPTTLPTKVKEKKIENTYTMYVKINPLVKLTLKETYTECIEEDGSKSICVDISDSIIDYELLNNDAKEVYDNLDFTGKTVLEALVMLCDTARENDIGFEKLEIVSDWDNIYNEEQIKEALKTNAKYEYEIGVYVDFTEYPEKSDILEDITKYIVTFDSDGGNKIEKQEVLENAKVEKPKDPIKEGYVFVEWQLNNKKYDFEKLVDKNITLKAKWKKIAEQEESTKKEDNTTENKENNSANKEPEKEEVVIKDTTESRIEKINLNENILFYHSGNGFGSGCGVKRYMIFATNLETLFPGYVKNKTISIITQQDIDRNKEEGFELDTTGLLMNTEWEAKKSQIIYDTTKEANLVKAFDTIASTKTKGINKFEYEFSNHELKSYSYGTISLEESNKFITLSNSLNSIRKKLDSQISSATNGMYTITDYFGGCGSMEPPELLTEEVCNKYNLTCERW